MGNQRKGWRYRWITVKKEILIQNTYTLKTYREPRKQKEWNKNLRLSHHQQKEWILSIESEGYQRREFNLKNCISRRKLLKWIL